MKIAMIGQKGIPVSSGGVEKHVEEICKRLVARGHEVTVYNRMGYSEIDSKTYLGINLKNVISPKIKGFEALIYSYFASMDSIFRNFDIVHYHALGPAAMSFLPKLSGKKVVVTIHGLDWQREKWGKIAKTYLKMGEKICCNPSQKVITVSNTLKKYYWNNYGKETVTIPNGITKHAPLGVNTIKKYHLEKGNYILFLSRIVPEKGCHYLLEAFKGLDTHIKLVIAGGSSYTDRYFNELKQNACDNIIFTGEVTGDLLTELYSNALFYVLPSEIEGLPISLLEAMSYGLCPLVSDIEENMEVIQDKSSYGFCFVSKDVNSLRNQLQYMLNNTGEVLNLGHTTQQYVLDKYNWDDVVDRLEALYKAM